VEWIITIYVMYVFLQADRLLNSILKNSITYLLTCPLNSCIQHLNEQFPFVFQQISE